MRSKKSKTLGQNKEQQEYLVRPHTPKKRKLPRNYQPPKEK